MKVLITGSAGFIGSALALRLLARGDSVIGVDNFNPYYSLALKHARQARALAYPQFSAVNLNIEDRAAVAALFAQERPERVVNLAAQAGVRYSIDNPAAYIDTNLVGFANILEGCRQTSVAHLVFASSSSVYGANRLQPFSVHHNVDHPVSLYAATKKANELMAHAYSHLYGLPATGLRFFTVYGPWGRPDMALFKFTQAILAGKPIDVYNHGQHRRDFTYIDDIVEGVVRVLDQTPAPDPTWSAMQPDPASAAAPYRLYNIGHHEPVELLHFISLIEQALGRRAELNLLPLQPGDVPDTYADIDDLAAATGYRPETPVATGVAQFIDWYLSYYPQPGDAS